MGQLTDSLIRALQDKVGAVELESIRLGLEQIENAASVVNSWTQGFTNKIQDVDFMGGGGANVTDRAGYHSWNATPAAVVETIRLETDGDAFFGSDLASPDTTVFAIFCNDQTYNGESMGAGDILMGSNSSGYANVLWDASAKQLKFRGGTSTQAYIDTNGNFNAGGVVLNSDGLSLNASASPSNADKIKFLLSSTIIAQIYSLLLSSTNFLSLESGPNSTYPNSNISLLAKGNSTSQLSNINISADLTGDGDPPVITIQNSSLTKTINLYGAGVNIGTTDVTSTPGNLNVTNDVAVGDDLSVTDDVTVGDSLDVNGHTALGANASVATTSVVNITETFADPGAAMYGLDVDPTTTLSANNAQQVDGIRILNFINQGSNNSTATIGTRGLDVTTRANGSSGTVTGIAASVLVSQNTGGGTVTTAFGEVVLTFNNTGGGAITNAVGSALGDQTVGTNNTLLLIGTITAPTGNWAIYNSSTKSNYFASPTLFSVTAAFGSERVAILAADNGVCLGLKINATQANVTGADTFIEFRSTSGVEGSVAGTGVAGVIAYNTFTGAHWTQLENGEAQPEIGMIVAASGRKIKNSGGKKQLQYVRKTSTKQDKTVFGVYAGAVKNSEDLAYGESGDVLNNTLSSGIGVVLVTKTNGDIMNGDYIQSSDVPGYGERQDDDLLHNYTVAKSLEDVIWSEEGSDVKLISCTYHCG